MVTWIWCANGFDTIEGVFRETQLLCECPIYHACTWGRGTFIVTLDVNEQLASLPFLQQSSVLFLPDNLWYGSFVFYGICSPPTPSGFIPPDSSSSLLVEGTLSSCPEDALEAGIGSPLAFCSRQLKNSFAHSVHAALPHGRME